MEPQGAFARPKNVPSTKQGPLLDLQTPSVIKHGAGRARQCLPRSQEKNLGEEEGREQHRRWRRCTQSSVLRNRSGIQASGSAEGSDLCPFEA